MNIPNFNRFIKYNNAIPIAASAILLIVGGSFAASPDFRENFISSQETIRSVDNSGIIAANLDNFNFGLRVKSAAEDVKNYYIIYIFKTLAIKDYIWQEIENEKTLTVAKEALGERDLGLYIAGELGEVIDYELSYLKEVQRLERENGLTQKVLAVEYSGLIGRFLNSEEKIFEGYQPVVQTPEAEVNVNQSETPVWSGTNQQSETVNQDLETQNSDTPAPQEETDNSEPNLEATPPSEEIPAEQPPTEEPPQEPAANLEALPPSEPQPEPEPAP